MAAAAAAANGAAALPPPPSGGSAAAAEQSAICGRWCGEGGAAYGRASAVAVAVAGVGWQLGMGHSAWLLSRPAARPNAISRVASGGGERRGRGAGGEGRESGRGKHGARALRRTIPLVRLEDKQNRG